MKKYLALLRGINVGGNNIIKMEKLRECLENAGFENVQTYIQSGNVVFDSNIKDLGVLENRLEKLLSEVFSYESTVIVLSQKQVETVMREVPKEWKIQNDIRKYIAFVKKPTTAKQVADEIPVKEGIDFMKLGNDVLYMTTSLSGITKSGVTKIIGKPIYKRITIRNYNTMQKIASIMG